MVHPVGEFVVCLPLNMFNLNLVCMSIFNENIDLVECLLYVMFQVVMQQT